MELSDILKLLETFSSSDMTQLKVSLKGDTLSVSRLSEPTVVKEKKKKSGNAPVMETSTADAPSREVSEAQAEPEKETSLEHLKMVKSPIVGSFYSRPADDEPPYVKVGDSVKAGETLCIIEAMKIMNEIKSPFTGIVEKIMVSDTEMVDYGKPLFYIREA